MNRLFFKPDQSGLSKVEAAKATLRYVHIYHCPKLEERERERGR